MDGRNLIDVFDCERQCEYRGRRYVVRDNGAILRLPKEGAKPNDNDNVWTFGKQDANTGYMLFPSAIRVHQVVATAFHGEPEDPKMVVDHKDTNKCNNRPENLQWVTRLENALNNPITRKKIELLCGSIEAFINDPTILRNAALEQNIGWMRAVSKDEAEKCRKNLTRWAEDDNKKPPIGKGIGEWIYKNDGDFGDESWDKDWMIRKKDSTYQIYDHMAIDEEVKKAYEDQYGLKDSLTPRAKQLEWKTPTEFPLTPQSVTDTPLKDYLVGLKKGEVFCRNQYSESPVFDAAMSEDESRLSVITEMKDVPKNYALAEITFSDGFFVHKSLGTFFTEEGAVKYFTLSLGREWTGGDVFDDFCM